MTRVRLRGVGLIAMLVLAVGFLSLTVPWAQTAWYTAQCSRLGGRLEQANDAVEPFVVARTVYLCRGPDGALLNHW